MIDNTLQYSALRDSKDKFENARNARDPNYRENVQAIYSELCAQTRVSQEHLNNSRITI